MAANRVEVLSRNDCTFNYCPCPDACCESCRNVAGPTDSPATAAEKPPAKPPVVIDWEDVCKINEAVTKLRRAGHVDLGEELAFIAFKYAGPGHS